MQVFPYKTIGSPLQEEIGDEGFFLPSRLGKSFKYTLLSNSNNVLASAYLL